MMPDPSSEPSTSLDQAPAYPRPNELGLTDFGRQYAAPQTQPYDPRPTEDKARRRIAYALIALLGMLVFAILYFVWHGKVEVTDIKEFAVLVGPVVTLVSAATGFYYGTRSGS